MWNSLSLDGCWRFIALAIESTEQNLGKAEIGKLCQSDTFEYACAVGSNRRRAIEDKPRVSGRLSGIGRQDSGGSDAKNGFFRITRLERLMLRRSVLALEQDGSRVNKIIGYNPGSPVRQRMKIAHHRPHPFVEHMRINLGSGNICVAK